jgi:hypothetical protein
MCTFLPDFKTDCTNRQPPPSLYIYSAPIFHSARAFNVAKNSIAMNVDVREWNKGREVWVGRQHIVGLGHEKTTSYFHSKYRIRTSKNVFLSTSYFPLERLFCRHFCWFLFSSIVAWHELSFFQNFRVKSNPNFTYGQIIFIAKLPFNFAKAVKLFYSPESNSHAHFPFSCIALYFYSNHAFIHE